jgi:predicted nuclease of restriction endonuclease-like (RecB) superfamily
MSDKKDVIEVENYTQLLEHIKRDIQQSQLKAAVAVNQELILLYWRIGKALSEKIDREGWGSKIIDTLAADLMRAFPGSTGFSVRNLKYMRKLAETYPDPICATAIAQIPWGHNITIMEKIDNNEKRLWYVQKCLENGWSRPTLTIFSFLTAEEKAREQEIEHGLMEHVQSFLIELGKGFAFLGRQYHLEVSNKDFYIDLLFYHITLRCFIVVELKAGEFEPKDAGQLNFYLTVVDKTLKRKDDNPTIGLLLVRTKDNLIAEYALQDIHKPMGIAGYETKLVESLPKELKSSLPTVEEIEAELEKVLTSNDKAINHNFIQDRV